MERRWWSACAVLAALTVAAGGSLSGLYVDNGFDQTMIQRAMSVRERRLMELEILNLLGIEERPRRARSAPLDRSAPSFLLDVYKSLAEERDQARPTRSSELTLSGEELHAIDESDLIMTFQSKRHQMESLRHEHGRHVWFDVSEVPPEQSLVGAELRLYQAPDHGAADPTAIYTVSVQKVVNVDSYGGLVLDQVTSVNTSACSEGWLELNVTAVFADWVVQPHTNRGFYITLHPLHAPELDVKPEEIGIVNVRGTEGKRPFMVAFYKAAPRVAGAAPGPDAEAAAASRRKRAANKRRRLPDHGYSDNYARNPLTDSSHWNTRSCQIQTLYVSFKDLEWQDWIIAPDGYGAFYCSGECNFPLNAHMNATNHAIVQTLVHLLNPNKVPKPCCAPTKLTPLAVLYFADDSNVILRKYKNMVVKSCGCH